MAGYTLFKQGYRATVDLGPQVLRVESPEDEWGIDNGPYDFADEDGFVDWNKPRQEEAAPEPSMADLRTSGRTAPLAALARKAKAVNDWLYATLDVAAHEGDGPFLGKKRLIARLGRQLTESNADINAQILPFAAASLSGELDLSSLPVASRLRTKKMLKSFEENPLRSKPIGFYTQSDVLQRIFRHDRLLQRTLDSEIADAMRQALEEADLEPAYRWHLRHAELMTGTFSWSSLLRESSGDISVFPPSRAPETDLVKRLYGNRPIPDDFVLLDEVIRQVRAGTLDLTPSESDGGYPRELYALSGLLQPESPRLIVGSIYQSLLDKLFKGLMSLARETHIKQLECPVAGSGIWDEEEEITFEIFPRLRLEPIPEYYRRLALAYSWWWQVISEHWGVDALEQERPGTDGRITTVASELEDMRALFQGAADLSFGDLGFQAADEKSSSPGDRARALSFARNWRRDPDVAADSRMMVPLYFDQGRGTTRVSVVCGYLSRTVDVSFEKRPEVAVLDPAGRAAEVPVTWSGGEFSTIYPVSFECNVRKILNRDELRSLADRHRAPSALKTALENL